MVNIWRKKSVIYTKQKAGSKFDGEEAGEEKLV